MKALVVVLVGFFGASTFVRQEERGEHCANCESQNSCDTADKPDNATGHAHGDADDRHETPESPCHHHQETHCCCAHLPTLTLAQGFALNVESISALFKLGDTCLLEDPPAREFFHVPIA